MSTALHTLDDLRARLSSHGAQPVHARRWIQAWLHGQSDDERRDINPARRPKTLEDALPALRRDLFALVSEVHAIADDSGAQRRLLRLASGRTVESVELPREGLCVSTQVGCAVGCLFCKTGADGLLQQLTELEILAQVVHSRMRRPVRRVVFMGMGEPSHNLEATLGAIAALGTEGQIPHKNLVFSTVGDPRVFDRLAAARVRPGLALSLHTLDFEQRRDLLPRAPQIDPRELLESAIEYSERVAYPLQIQWTVLAGVNDGLDAARHLAEGIGARRAIVNYIPFNSVEGNGFQRPAMERCVELVRTVRACGGIATLRDSAAQQIEGGCGQLRARRVGQEGERTD